MNGVSFNSASVTERSLDVTASVDAGASDLPLSVESVARASACHWRFLCRTANHVLPVKASGALAAYVKKLSTLEVQRVAQSLASQQISFHTNLELVSDQVTGTIPVLWKATAGWVVAVPRYSAHVHRDTKVTLGGCCALALANGWELAPWAEVPLATGKTQTFLVSEVLELWHREHVQALQLWSNFPPAHTNPTGGIELQFGVSDWPVNKISDLGSESGEIWRNYWFSCRRVCGNCSDCKSAIKIYDDLLQICGLGAGLRWKLLEQGIATATQLANTDPNNIRNLVNRKLWEQACLQVKTGSTPMPGKIELRVDALAKIWDSLPDGNAGDVYLDFENDSLWDWDLSDHTGLVYLAGVVTRMGSSEGDSGADGSGKEGSVATDKVVSDGVERSCDYNRSVGVLSRCLRMRYLQWWAHDRAGEKQLLIALVQWLEQRRQQYPSFHVYHYSEQEVLYLRRLAARHSCCQEEISRLTGSQGVFVDLLKVVQGAVQIGLPSYALKHLEPLYLEDLPREGEIGDGGESVVAYDEWRRFSTLKEISEVAGFAFQNAARPGSGQFCPCDDGVVENRGDVYVFPCADVPLPPVLAGIARYNEYDCNSTYRLHQWLLQQRKTARNNWLDQTQGGRSS